jgi:YD repeat-containing protein
LQQPEEAMGRTSLKTAFALLFLAAISILQIAAGPFAETKNWFTCVDVGNGMEKCTISSPPKAPEEFVRETANLPEPDKTAGINSLAVPAFDWVMGCSATSGSMIAAYYDRNGYSNMYTGPANGGVMPMDNSVWSTWNDGFATYGQCPLTASRNGLDGRSTRGSMEDYWVQYNSAATDPWIINGWTQHAWGDAIADYMKTSESAYGNIDGTTTFYFNSSSAAPLTCADLEGSGHAPYDGTYGIKLFYGARGYTVTDCYSQATDNVIAGGFSFSQFQAEIDAGRPVLINLQGHTIVGVGYDTAGNTVYLNDTWDRSTHTMTWGGSYAGRATRSVSIVHLAVPTPPGAFGKIFPPHTMVLNTSPSLVWGTSSDATNYEYCFDTSNNDACDGSWISAGFTTGVSLSGLTNNATYYWQVRATKIGGTTYADGGAWWSFTSRNQTFADVPIDHALWVYIEAFYNAGITTGCGVSPLIYCPEQPVTRASMTVFLLRAKYGSSYTPPAATHTFADLPVAGKEWQEAWVDQFYLEGITSGCGTGPLIYCPENPVTRAAMAVFILRAKYGSSYTPPATSHFFADLPVAGKEWMEPWVDELYREGITTGCGTGPLIYCPETAVKRQAMAAFIVRAFDLPMP